MTEYQILDLRQIDPKDLSVWFAEADAERRAKIRAYRWAIDRLRSLCADHLAREMLAQRSGLPREALQFHTDANGKPAANVPIHFNVSHSGNFVACAVGDSPVGVDIEELRTVRAALCGKVCTEEERLCVCPNGSFDGTRFLALWTAKEAALKCTGEGLRADLRSFSVIKNAQIDLSPRAFRHEVTAQYALTVVCETGEIIC